MVWTVDTGLVSVKRDIRGESETNDASILPLESESALDQILLFVPRPDVFALKIGPRTNSFALTRLGACREHCLETIAAVAAIYNKFVTA